MSPRFEVETVDSLIARTGGWTKRIKGCDNCTRRRRKVSDKRDMGKFPTY